MAAANTVFVLTDAVVTDAVRSWQPATLYLQLPQSGGPHLEAALGGHNLKAHNLEGGPTTWRPHWEPTPGGRTEAYSLEGDPRPEGRIGSRSRTHLSVGSRSRTHLSVRSLSGGLQAAVLQSGGSMSLGLRFARQRFESRSRTHQYRSQWLDSCTRSEV